MKIVASLTTIPGREKGVVKCVQRLLEIYPFASISITIPMFYPRIGKKYKQETIDELKSLDRKVEVTRIKRDWGPGTKFFGYKDGVATFVCDDDRLYTSALLNKLIRKYQRFKGRCVVTGARKLMGTCGILIPPDVLNGYKRYLSTLPNRFREIDDNTMEIYLLKMGRKIKYFRGNAQLGRLQRTHALVQNKDRRRYLWRQYSTYVCRNRNHPDVSHFKRIGGSQSTVLRQISRSA